MAAEQIIKLASYLNSHIFHMDQKVHKFNFDIKNRKRNEI